MTGFAPVPRSNPMTDEMLEAGARAINSMKGQEGYSYEEFCRDAAQAAYTAMRALDPEWIAMREEVLRLRHAVSSDEWEDPKLAASAAKPISAAEALARAALQPRQSK